MSIVVSRLTFVLNRPTVRDAGCSFEFDPQCYTWSEWNKSRGIYSVSIARRAPLTKMQCMVPGVIVRVVYGMLCVCVMPDVNNN
jgi:hypothetical protein